jgi:hypothetical protein
VICEQERLCWRKPAAIYWSELEIKTVTETLSKKLEKVPENSFKITTQRRTINRASIEEKEGNPKAVTGLKA